MTSTTTPEPVTAKDIDIILTPSALFDKMQEWIAKGWHVITPATRASHFAQGWGVSVALVVLDTRIDDSGNGVDCYFDKGSMKPHERGLSRIGLDRICRCAGISWDPVHSGRVDPRTLMHFAEFRAIGVVMNFDGTPETFAATGCCDYRDGAADIGYWTPEDWRKLEQDNERKKLETPTARVEWHINGWSAKRVLGARAKVLQRAETNAKERAIRSLGIRQKYSVEKLSKPFVVLKAAYLPNMEDPAIRQMVAERAMNGTRALFSPPRIIDITPEAPRALPEAPAPERIERPVPAREPEPVARQAAPTTQDHIRRDIDEALAPLSPAGEPKRAETASAPAQPSPSVVHQPTMTPAGVTVNGCEFLKEGLGPKGAWRMFKVTFSDGKSFTAFEGKDGLVADADKYRLSGQALEYRTKKDGNYTNLVDILPAGAQPALAGLTSAPAMADLKL